MSNYTSIYHFVQNNPILRCFLRCFDIYYCTTTKKETVMKSWNKRTQQKVEKMTQSAPERLMWVYKKFEHSEYDNYRLYRVIPRDSYGNIRRGGWVRYNSVDNKS